MALETVHSLAARLWELVARQHGVVSWRQLIVHGFTPDAIRHRVRKGRLWPMWRGVYAVGRPGVTRYGVWMAAVLACGESAVLSHSSAAALWGVAEQVGAAHVSAPASRRPRGKSNLQVHRRREFAFEDQTERYGIPVTGPIQTLVDIAPGLSRAELDRVINEADRLELVRADQLREGLGAHAGRHGAPALRDAPDTRTFALTRSHLERLFLPLARRAGLPKPRTAATVNGFEVDFWWPDLRLIVETDGLRYHRTPVQQARDRIRDQAHQAAGDYPLRFTHAQVRYEPAYVERILRTVGQQLRSRPWTSTAVQHR